MKYRFDKMLLRSNNTFGDIQAGFMKLIPLYTLKRVRSAPINVGPTKEEQVIDGGTNHQDRSRSSIELEVVPGNKNRSKRKSRSRNSSVRVVNRNQAKAMSSLQALRGASVKSNGSLSPSFSGTRHYSAISDDSDPPSPCLEQEIVPYTLTVDLSESHEKLHTHILRHHSLIDTRKVRFN